MPEGYEGIRQSKAELRSEVRLRRAQMHPDERLLANRQVFERAHKLDAFQLATCVHIYRSLPEEVDTWPFFEYAWGIGKKVYVPVSTSSGLLHVTVTRDTVWIDGAFGIPEPADIDRSSNRVQTHAQPLTSLPAELTLVIVPMVAFDKQCHRLGYGKGYYDRFLGQTGITSMGLAYEVQKADAVPVEEHDVTLSCVATDQRWYIT